MFTVLSSPVYGFEDGESLGNYNSIAVTDKGLLVMATVYVAGG